MFLRAALITPHLAALGLSLIWYGSYQDDPRVFLYAYFLTCLLELFSLAVFLHLYPGSPRWLQGILERITRRPARGEVSHPIRVKGGGSAGLGSITFVFTVIFFFGFVLANVNSDKELDLTWVQLLAELTGAGPLCLVYFLETLLGRSLVADFQATPAINYGYNSSQLTYLALAILSSAALMVLIQDSLDHSTGWVVVGPLLFFRHGTMILQGMFTPGAAVQTLR